MILRATGRGVLAVCLVLQLSVSLNVWAMDAERKLDSPWFLQRKPVAFKSLSDGRDSVERRNSRDSFGPFSPDRPLRNDSPPGSGSSPKSASKSASGSHFGSASGTPPWPSSRANSNSPVSELDSGLKESPIGAVSVCADGKFDVLAKLEGHRLARPEGRRLGTEEELLIFLSEELPNEPRSGTAFPWGDKPRKLKCIDRNFYRGLLATVFSFKKNRMTWYSVEELYRILKEAISLKARVQEKQVEKEAKETVVFSRDLEKIEIELRNKLSMDPIFEMGSDGSIGVSYKDAPCGRGNSRIVFKRLFLNTLDPGVYVLEPEAVAVQIVQDSEHADQKRLKEIVDKFRLEVEILQKFHSVEDPMKRRGVIKAKGYVARTRTDPLLQLHLVMPLYESNLGKTTILEKLTFQQKLEILLNASIGMENLHDVIGLTHHDIKPDNIMISGYSTASLARKDVVIADFGSFVSRERLLLDYYVSPINKEAHELNTMDGTMGFKAPEAVYPYRKINTDPELPGYVSENEFVIMTQKRDVYAFGITMLSVLRNIGTEQMQLDSYNPASRGEMMRQLIQDKLSKAKKEISGVALNQVEKEILRSWETCYNRAAREIYEEIAQKVNAKNVDLTKPATGNTSGEPREEQIRLDLLALIRDSLLDNPKDRIRSREVRERLGYIYQNYLGTLGVRPVENSAVSGSHRASREFEEREGKSKD